MCSKAEENDLEDPMRIVNCSTMEKCYNYEILAFDNQMCGPEETCASWSYRNRKLNGCIKTHFCD